MLPDWPKDGIWSIGGNPTNWYMSIGGTWVLVFPATLTDFTYVEVKARTVIEDDIAYEWGMFEVKTHAGIILGWIVKRSQGRLLDPLEQLAHT